jgi:hypothetical protein
MKPKLSLSILVLFVLFTTNLFSRLLVKNINTTMSLNQISVNAESDHKLDLIPFDVFHLVIFTPETQSVEHSDISSFLEWKTSGPSLNILYLANPPPSFS